MGRWQLVVECVRFVCGADFWRMAVLWAWFLVVSHLQILLPKLFSTSSTTYPRSTSFSFTPLCIVTGATSGLGAAAAHSLSKEGFYVVLVGRSSQLLSKTMREIKTRNKHAQLKAFQVDLSLFPSISKFKVSLEQWLLDSNMHCSVQLLINNAGILATSPRLTAEGYDETIATNYIGAFYLTNLLLPLLKNSPMPSRIVNVTSFTHRSVSSIQVNKDAVSGNCFSRSKRYPYARIYEYSKLYLLLFSYELHRQLCLNDESHQISVIAADPGVVETNIMREVPSFLSRLAFIVLKLLGLLQSPENGVGSILDAALAPPDISGVYFFGGKGRTMNSSELSYNARLAQELWTTTSDLLLQSQLALKETSNSSSDSKS
ncbi:Dehydrogenase/reductase SDR family member on chromosome X [Morus notabilis]|uniref:Dehydrogenase/reductase SDR family member on chromosome X n=1 Tax=Morus notabilis TaxID=981085 RepID=W9QGK8_9ROSA|nr:dehydrogenase/reductase SDR family member on chromosome X [Morus notabilis]EXB36901.1 Dehydrogenase/reductase SDR family member on chromosome X [Morus notabilis]